MPVVVGWVCLSILVGALASNKGRSAIGFFCLSILLSPLVGLIAVLIAKADVEAVEAKQVESGTMKRCPFCAEMVKAEARVCRYCQRELPGAAVSAEGIVIDEGFKPRYR